MSVPKRRVVGDPANDVAQDEVSADHGIGDFAILHVDEAKGAWFTPTR